MKAAPCSVLGADGRVIKPQVAHAKSAEFAAAEVAVVADVAVDAGVETVLLIDTNDSANAAAKLMIGVAKFCKVLMIGFLIAFWWTVRRSIRQLKLALHGACQFAEVQENRDMARLVVPMRGYMEPRISEKS